MNDEPSVPTTQDAPIVGEKLETNRTKAVISMNLYALITIFFIVSCKFVVNDNKVSPIDLVFLVHVMLIPITTIILLTTSESFIVPKETRRMFSARLCLGWLCAIIYVIGSTLVSLTVQQTMINTIPFWASICGYCLAKESITFFEAVLMLISFGGVLLVAFGSSGNNVEDRVILKNNPKMA